MSLIVEDGTGLANAEAYCSVADVSAYHEAMGGGAWDGEIPALEAAIRRACQYIDTHYSFRGFRMRPDTQALAFPRDLDTAQRGGATSPDYWPVPKLRDAVCELAVRALTTDLFADIDASTVVEETVGPITTKYGRAKNGGQVRFSIVDALLAPMISGGGLSMRIERA